MFRQLRAEYFRLSEKEGLADDELMARMRHAYWRMVKRTDPLNRHRGAKGGKPAEAWTCPKVLQISPSSYRPVTDLSTVKRTCKSIIRSAAS